MCTRLIHVYTQGVLNYKYLAEEALRSSGLTYAIVRATGTIPYFAVNDTRRLEFAQGDMISGRVTRPELAHLLHEVITSAHAVGKTFEVRRDESDSGLIGSANWGNQQTDLPRLLRRLVHDEDRSLAGLAPFPPAQDPPAPLSEAQAKVRVFVLMGSRFSSL